MSGNSNEKYWAERAAEERQIAAGLPDGPAAIAHVKLAELYEKASREFANGQQNLHPALSPEV